MSTATQQPPAKTTAEKVIDQIGFSSQALAEADTFMKTAEAKQAEVTGLIPACVDAMVQHERVNPDQREKLAEMLQDPAEAIRFLTKVAGHRNREEVAHLGNGVDANGHVKTAGANGAPQSYDSLQSPHVGARTTMTKQSDDRFYRGLGLTPPTADA